MTEQVAWKCEVDTYKLCDAVNLQCDSIERETGQPAKHIVCSPDVNFLLIDEAIRGSLEAFSMFLTRREVPRELWGLTLHVFPWLPNETLLILPKLEE
jgi:hypothetical protein